MGMLPDARNRAGMGTATRRRAASLSRAFMAVTLLTGALASQARAAESAQDVLKKLNAVYMGAKSFTGSLTVRQSGKSPDGKAVSVTFTQQIQYKSPNLFVVRTSASGTGAAAAQARNLSRLAVSDGRTVYNYRPSDNKYVKQPAPPNIALAQILQFIPNAHRVNASIVSQTSAQGRPAYVVQVKLPSLPSLPPNATPQQKAQYQKIVASIRPPQFVVDKQNYHLLRLTQAAQGNEIQVTFGAQNMNANIAGNPFVFAIPRGATEVQMPAPTPGAPGAPVAPGR